MEIVIDVKAGQLKTNAQGKIEMTRKELRDFMNSYGEEAVMVTLLSTIAWLMEEPEFQGEKDRLNDIFVNVQRVIETTLDPNEPFDKYKLARVVKEGTGIQVRFSK